MANNLQLDAEVRTDMGKGASRRLRRENKIPAIIYGAGKEPQTISLLHNKVTKALENEDFYTQILTLNIDKKTEQIVLKDLQRHVYKPKIMHMDFLRIKADEELTMHIPLHFTGEESAPGVKQSGVISHTVSEVEIKCLPADLPKFIEVDVSTLDLNQSIHLSELKLPKGVSLNTVIDEAHDQPVVSIAIARAAVVVEEEEAPVEAEAETPAAEETKE